MPDWYHIVLWVGNGGGGKTTGMVRDLYREMEYGTRYKKAYCNIDVRHPKVEKITYEELKNLRGDLVDGKPTTLVCIDQLHKYMDSRQSMSPRNIYMSSVVIESRQHGFDLRGTTWGRTSIDGRVRKYVELDVLSERTSRGFRYTLIDTNNNRIRSLPLIPFGKCEKYWRVFDMNELVEDVDPRWDPRIDPISPGQRGQKKAPA